MTLGEGIFYSISLILFVFALYQITKHKKWKIIGLTFGALIVVSLAVSGGAWSYSWYQDRPHAIQELDGIAFGMSPVDITLLRGKPSETIDPVFDDNEYTMRMTYEQPNSGELVILFDGDSLDALTVTAVCSSGNSAVKLFGLNERAFEADVADKLGEPSQSSIDTSGYHKFINYEQYNSSFRISRGKVVGLCIISSGMLAYNNEYDPSSLASPSEAETNDPE